LSPIEGSQKQLPAKFGFIKTRILAPIFSLLSFLKSFFGHFNYRKVLIFATSGLVVVGLLVTGGVFAFNEYQITSTDKVRLSDVLAADQIRGLEKQACDFSDNLLPSDTQNSVENKRFLALVQQVDSKSSRSALKFRNGNAWTYDTLVDPQESLDKYANRELGVRLSKNPRILRSALGSVLRQVSKDFQNRALISCGLEKKFADRAVFVSSYNSEQADFIAKASSAPWYPESYFEVGDGLAIKYNTQSGSWPCTDCSFWKIKVISRDGCPGGVYIELSITQGGVAVDWTNDSLSALPAGGVGQMVFTTYPYIPNSKGEIAEATCHQY
jgi:hypothetical protein